MTPREGYHKHPDTVTLTGEKFAPSGNIVTLGFQHCPVTKENSSYIECTVPRHVGGTYGVTVENPAMGLAEGSSMWFRFRSGVIAVTPNTGSKYRAGDHHHRLRLCAKSREQEHFLDLWLERQRAAAAAAAATAEECDDTS